MKNGFSHDVFMLFCMFSLVSGANLPVVLWHGMGASSGTAGGTSVIKKIIEDNIGDLDSYISPALPEVYFHHQPLPSKLLTASLISIRYGHSQACTAFNKEHKDEHTFAMPDCCPPSPVQGFALLPLCIMSFLCKAWWRSSSYAVSWFLSNQYFCLMESLRPKSFILNSVRLIKALNENACLKTSSRFWHAGSYVLSISTGKDAEEVYSGFFGNITAQVGLQYKDVNE